MTKKDMKSIIGGIVNSNKLIPKEQAEDQMPEVLKELQLSKEMEMALEAERKKNVGRPKKGEEERIRENRTTFIVDKETVRKLKYIAVMDCTLIKDIVAEAFDRYIEEWERKKGHTIKLPKN